MRSKLLALLVLTLLAGSVAACGSDDDGDENGSAAATTAAAPATTAEQATTASPETDTAPAGECKTVGTPVPKPDGGSQAPEDTLDPAKKYSLVVVTNCGSFTIALDQKLAPNTSASLVALAQAGFFDSTTFHRVVPGFVIQGGDPTGTGTGGPGYSTVDVPPSDAKYTTGVVAMAKTGAEPAGTSGSQFFVVTAADAGLPPEYAIVGKVTEGLDTVTAIEGLGAGDGPPSKPVVIEKVTVEES
jgi:peptidyl-prolyl cis-trans isomerase B (cyclophilin B)